MPLNTPEQHQGMHHPLHGLTEAGCGSASGTGVGQEDTARPYMIEIIETTTISDAGHEYHSEWSMRIIRLSDRIHGIRLSKSLSATRETV